MTIKENKQDRKSCKNSKIPLEFFRVCNYNRLQNIGYKKAYERDSFFPLFAIDIKLSIPTTGA